jgi:NitT/TauT family transport system substrate-binding protein
MLKPTVGFTAAFALAATLALSGCNQAAKEQAGASGGKGTKINFQLNFAPGGFNAGFAVAKQEGLYAKQGLNVTITPGNGSSTTAQLVSTGKADIAYADAVPVMQLIAKGAPMKLVSTIYQANPDEVTVLASSKVHKIQDLKGMSVGVPSGSSQTPLLPLLLKANHMKQSDVKLVNLPMTSLAPALVQGKVDSILGSLDFYDIQLQKLHAKTRGFLFSDHGIPTVSTSIVARNDYLKTHSAVVKKFVAASIQGWQDAIKNPQASAQALAKTFQGVDTALSVTQLKAIQPLFCASGAKNFGKAEPEAWASSQNILAQAHSLPSGFDPKKYYTYDYLPASLPSC